MLKTIDEKPADAALQDSDSRTRTTPDSAVDATERRRSEADLKAIETYAQNIVDTVREPLLILDGPGGRQDSAIKKIRGGRGDR